MKKSKSKGIKAGDFAKGGSNAMIGKKSAGPAASGTTMSHRNGGDKFIKGGGSKMAGKQAVKPAKKQ